MIGLAVAQAATVHTLDVNGVERSVVVEVPDGMRGKGKRPGLVAFHGGGPDHSDHKGAPFARRTALAKAAGVYGAVTAFPDGLDGRWHPKGSEVDDLAFADAVADLLVRTYGVDPGRIAAAGFSSGGHQAMQWACHSGRVSSIAVVGAGLSERQFSSCRLTLPMPMMFLLGRKDPINPIHGGEVVTEKVVRGRVLSGRDSAGYFAEANGCKRAKEGVLYAPNGRKAADRLRWKGCGRGKVELLVADVGHVWPLANTPNADKGASRVIAMFFRKRAWRKPVRR